VSEEVGVMNIMLVSVTETHERDRLLKALGARRRDILKQFLLESLTLTFLAGIVGMIVAILVAYLIPPMPLYSDIYKTANHEGDILLRASTRHYARLLRHSRRSRHRLWTPPGRSRLRMDPSKHYATSDPSERQAFDIRFKPLHVEPRQK